MEVTLEEEKLMNATIRHCCSICLHAVTDNVLVRPCYHVFCRACIEKWFARSYSCPNCRALIDVYLRKAEVTGLIILVPVPNAIVNQRSSSPSSSSSSDDEDNDEDSSDDEEDSFQTEQIIMNGVEYLPRTSSAVVVSAELRQVEQGQLELQSNHSDFYYVSDLSELQLGNYRNQMVADTRIIGRQESDDQSEESHHAYQEQQQPNRANDSGDSWVRIFANIHVEEDISDFRWDSSNRNDGDDNDNTDLGDSVNVRFIRAQNANDMAEENTETATIDPCVPCIMHQRELQNVSNSQILP